MLPFLASYITNLVIKGCTRVLMVRLIVLVKDIVKVIIISLIMTKPHDIINKKVKPSLP